VFETDSSPPKWSFWFVVERVLSAFSQELEGIHRYEPYAWHITPASLAGHAHIHTLPHTLTRIGSGLLSAGDPAPDLSVNSFQEVDKEAKIIEINRH
jgi:hypothetical protein